MSQNPPRQCVTSMKAIGTSERFCLTVLRLWVEEQLGKEQAGVHWREGLEQAGMPKGTIEAFDTFMIILSSTAIRSIDVRASTIGCVSRDEVKFLELIASVQSGDFPKFQYILSEWLPITALRAAAMPFASVAGAFEVKNIRVSPPDLSLAPKFGKGIALADVDWASQAIH